MILKQLKNHLRLNGAASLLDMSLRVNRDPALVRDMLQCWIQKGRVRKCMKTPECGSRCSRCDPLQVEIYEWIS